MKHKLIEKYQEELINDVELINWSKISEFDLKIFKYQNSEFEQSIAEFENSLDRLKFSIFQYLGVLIIFGCEIYYHLMDNLTIFPISLLVYLMITTIYNILIWIFVKKNLKENKKILAFQLQVFKKDSPKKLT